MCRTRQRRARRASADVADRPPNDPVTFVGIARFEEPREKPSTAFCDLLYIPGSQTRTPPLESLTLYQKAQTSWRPYGKMR